MEDQEEGDKERRDFSYLLFPNFDAIFGEYGC